MRLSAVAGALSPVMLTGVELKLKEENESIGHIKLDPALELRICNPLTEVTLDAVRSTVKPSPFGRTEIKLSRFFHEDTSESIPARSATLSFPLAPGRALLPHRR